MLGGDRVGSREDGETSGEHSIIIGGDGGIHGGERRQGDGDRTK